MRKVIVIAMLAAGAPMLSGCVAAIVPALAAGALGASRVDGDEEVGGSKQADAAMQADPSAAAQTDIATPLIQEPASPAALAAAPSGETEPPGFARSTARPTGGGYSLYADLLSYAARQKEARSASGGATGAVLVPRVDLDAPETMACADKPFAVIVDLDGNDEPRLSEATGLQPQPGLARALDELRAANVRVTWISDSPQAMEPAVRSILEFAGLSRPADRDLLLLKRADDDRKQLRRQEVAADHCVLAIAGDDYDDFDELYDYLLYPEAAAPLDAKFGNGWFLVPPPFAASPPRAEAIPTP